MTNQEIRLSLIKKAYGKHFEKYNATGSISMMTGEIHAPIHILPKDIDWIPYQENMRNVWIPKELLNLWDNNGWIRIEPDGSNLPTEDGDYYFIAIDNPKDDGQSYYSYRTSQKANFLKWFTHFRPKSSDFPKPKW